MPSDRGRQFHYNSHKPHNKHKHSQLLMEVVKVVEVVVVDQHTQQEAQAHSKQQHLKPDQMVP